MTQKDKFRLNVEAWLFAFAEFRRQTNGFSLDIETLTADELSGLKLVGDWFLQFEPFMYRVLAPKEHAKVKRSVAYLAYLQKRQMEAMQTQTTESEAQSKKLNALVKTFHLLTAEQREKHTKEIFGWEQGRT